VSERLCLFIMIMNSGRTEDEQDAHGDLSSFAQA
jgi:hypothetical protein